MHFQPKHDDSIPLASRTLALLMNHISIEKDHEDAWEDLVKFTEKHPDWCETVASYVMKKRSWKYESFTKQFMYLALEPVGITI